MCLCCSGRGGQSALRFARLRMEKRHNYVRKVAEVAVQLFITNDRPNVAGLVLAGSADFKTELSQSDMFDPVSSTLKLVFLNLEYFWPVEAPTRYRMSTSLGKVLQFAPLVLPPWRKSYLQFQCNRHNDANHIFH